MELVPEKTFVGMIMDEHSFPENFPTLESVQTVYDQKAVQFHGSAVCTCWHKTKNKLSSCWMFDGPEDAKEFKTWMLESKEWESTCSSLNAIVAIF